MKNVVNVILLTCLKIVCINVTWTVHDFCILIKFKNWEASGEELIIHTFITCYETYT